MLPDYTNVIKSIDITLNSKHRTKKLKQTHENQKKERQKNS